MLSEVPSSTLVEKRIELNIIETVRSIQLASYIHSVRGGGDGHDSPDKKIKGDGNNDQKDLCNVFYLASKQNNAATVQSAHLATSQQQIQAQRRHKADMINALAVLWTEQERNGLAMLYAQTASVPSMISHHT
jgi:hypothetical protein